MVRGRLTVPSGPRNPGGFDHSKFLLSQGAGAQLYLTPGQGEALPPSTAPGFKAALFRKVYALKNRILDHFREYLPPHEAALLGGILFGLRSGLPPAVEENFRAAGVSHLLAVSGLHVGLLAFLVIRLLGLLRIRGERVYLWSLPILGAFALFTGFRPAVLRALLMFGFLVVAQILGRDRDFLSALALAALASLLINPFFLFMPGFQLSYAGIMFIVYFYERLKGFFGVLPSFLQGIAAVSLAAQLGVAPLTGYHFQQVSLVALVANLLLVACMTAVLGGGLAGAVLFTIWPLGSGVVLKLLKPLLTLFLVITETLSALPLATLQTPKVPLLLLILYYTVFIIYLNKDAAQKFLLTVQYTPKKLVFAGLISLCLVSAASLWPHIQKGNNLEVTFLDVGQGASVFVLTPSGRSILVDTGGALFPQSRDPGEDVLIPFLHYKGVKRLDLLFISHPHVDHYGGAFALFRDNPPRTLVVGSPSGEAGYLELLRLAGEKGVEVYAAAAGESLVLGPGIELHVYHPPREKTPGGMVSSADENNDSLVLRLIYNEISFLFTGDIEEETEILLVKHAAALQSTFLQVPHHGSGNSSTQAFIDRVNARAAIIPVGANPFGHPAAGVLMRLEGQGGEIYRTDWHGAVTIKTDGVRYTIRTMLEGPAQSAKSQGKS
jgi:competence protein ComEC